MIQLSGNREAGLSSAKTCAPANSTQPAQFVGSALGRRVIEYFRSETSPPRPPRPSLASDPGAASNGVDRESAGIRRRESLAAHPRGSGLAADGLPPRPDRRGLGRPAPAVPRIGALPLRRPP